MIETFNQLICRHPLVVTISLGGCLVIAFVVLVVWKEIFQMEFWNE